MSKGTRSTTNLPGPVRDYILENNTSTMPETEENITNPENIQQLLAMMTRTLAAVTQSQPNQTSQHLKIENCPIKRPSSSLDAWVDEVLLWDESNAATDPSMRAKKYLKFVDSVRKSENCQDIQNLVEVKFVENQSFDKKGEYQH